MYDTSIALEANGDTRLDTAEGRISYSEPFIPLHIDIFAYCKLYTLNPE